MQSIKTKCLNRERTKHPLCKHLIFAVLLAALLLPPTSFAKSSAKSNKNIAAKSNKPYYIKSSVSTAGEGYSYAGLDIELYNSSNKAITSYTVIFRLFDADGLPAMDEDYKTVKVEANIPSGESAKTCISLDDYIDDAAAGRDEEDEWGEPYGIDLIFVGTIAYSDGSVWQSGDKY